MGAKPREIEVTRDNNNWRYAVHGKGGQNFGEPSELLRGRNKIFKDFFLFHNSLVY